MLVADGQVEFGAGTTIPRGKRGAEPRERIASVPGLRAEAPRRDDMSAVVKQCWYPE